MADIRKRVGLPDTQPGHDPVAEISQQLQQAQRSPLQRVADEQARPVQVAKTISCRIEQNGDEYVMHASFRFLPDVSEELRDEYARDLSENGLFNA